MEEELLSTSGTLPNELAFELNIPGPKIPHVSRGVTPVDENTVETLDVLFFSPLSKGARMFRRHEKIRGYTIDAEYKITAKLKLSPEEAGCDMVFIANAADVVTTIDATDTKATALEKLTVAQQNKWDIENMPIPMCGEITLAGSDIQEGNKIEGIRLIRMLARIDVKVASDVSNFTLDQVFLCNRYLKGYIAPKWESDGSIVKGAQLNYSVDFPFEDNQSMANSSLELIPNISYEVDPDNNSSVGRIYTFEAPGNSIDGESMMATCLVVKGYIDNDLSQAHYYRVDFTNTQGAFNPLLRNHQYIVEITAVNGIGYPNIEDALNAYTVVSNMHTRTLVWDNENISCIHFNGQYMLGVQYEEMTFSSMGEILTNFVVTDYGNGIEIIEKPDWIPLINIKGNKTQASLEVIVPANPEIEAREGVISVQAGRLIYTIRVKQNQKRGKDRSNAVVHIVSTDRIGCLGDSEGDNINSAKALRKVLETHFRMGGTVELKELKFYKVNRASLLTKDYLKDKDVLVMVYAAEPDAAVMNIVKQWLEESPKRVLVISFDSDRTNREAFNLDYFKDGIDQLIYGNKDETAHLVYKPGAEYFWKDGPFTNGQLLPNASYLNSDNIFGEATLTANSPIIPILEINGAMFFGVNKDKRIVYVGDSQYGDEKGLSKYKGVRFNNEDGTVSNNIEKVFANMWAWIIDEVVLKD